MSEKTKAKSPVDELKDKGNPTNNEKSPDRPDISDVPISQVYEDLSKWKTIGNKIKKYPQKRHISKEIFKIALDELFKSISPIIMNKIRRTVTNFNPRFKEGTDSFVKKLIVYSYDFDSEVNFKHKGKEYKLKIFSDLIKKCNRKNKNGEWLNNSFMDRLINWAKPSGRNIIFTSCRKYDFETKKPINGKYIIMAKWTYHRSEEEEDNDSTSNEDDESSE